MRRTNGRYIDLGNPVAKHPLNEGLVAWWLPLPNNQGGGTLFDLLGRYNGMLTSGPTWVAGPSGFQAPSFDGSNDYVALPANVLSSTTFTLAVRFYPTSISTYHAAFSIYASDSNSVELFIHAEGGNGSLGGGNYSNWARASAVLSANQWAWVGLTSTGSVTQLYLNGDTTGTTGTTNISTFSEVAEIGSRESIGSHLYPFSGVIAEVKLYNGRCLDASLMQKLYDDGMRGYPDTLRRRPKRSYGFTQAAPAGGRPPVAAYRMNTNKVIRGL